MRVKDISKTLRTLPSRYKCSINVSITKSFYLMLYLNIVLMSIVVNQEIFYTSFAQLVEETGLDHDVYNLSSSVFVF